MKNIPDESVDLIVTDPPYKCISGGKPHLKGQPSGMLSKNDGKIFDYNDIEPEEWFPLLYRKLKNGSHCYIMTNHVNLIHMLNVFTSVGFHFIKSLIWDKGNKIMGRFYMSQFEYILFFRKGKGVKINHCGTSDILSIPNKKLKGEDGKNLHDTEKPIALMDILIDNSSRVGDCVLDPFFGIGSIACSCNKLNRNFIGYEIDEQYYNIACHRLIKQANEYIF
jgi:site-specific DNA-methyltransferase (adenine-specific)